MVLKQQARTRDEVTHCEVKVTRARLGAKGDRKIFSSAQSHNK